MRTVDLVLPRLHTEQLRIKQGARRFNVLACGRRFGKTTLGQDLAVHPLLQGYPVGWFAPSYKILLEAWQVLTATLAPITRRLSQQEKRIELVTGGVLEAWSLADNPDVGRSRKYKRAIMDEWSLVTKGREAWQSAIRPTLTDLQGDAWWAGTPKGRNHFWELFSKGQDELEVHWASWQKPTSANPHIKPSEIEAARQELPERVFAQEYLAAFLEDGGGVFRGVQAAAVGEALEVGEEGAAYSIGVDWARTNDFTIFSVIDLAKKRQVYLDRFNNISFEIQVGRLKALMERFPPSVIVAERNAIGMPLVEYLQSQGHPVVAFETTNATKQIAIDSLAMAFERGELAILNDAVQTGELLAFEQERLPSGLIRYGAPDGQHDDTVMGLALAWHGAAAAYRPALLW